MSSARFKVCPEVKHPGYAKKVRSQTKTPSPHLGHKGHGSKSVFSFSHLVTGFKLTVRKMLRQVQRLVKLAWLFATVLVVIEAGSFSSADDQLDAIDERLGKLAARAEAFQERLDKRLDKGEIADRRLLMNRVMRMEEPSCAKADFLCDVIEHQCVSKLFVCDGFKDCRNGADESDCEMPFKVKDVYYGEEIFDNCVLRRPGAMTIVIKNIQSPPFYPGHPRVKVLIIINYQDKVIRGSVALPSFGHYSFADRRLVISPPLPNVRGLACKFDGVRNHVFIGDVMTLSHRDACARFHFVRK